MSAREIAEGSEAGCAADRDSSKPRWDRRAVLTGALMTATAAVAEWATPHRLMAQEQPLPALADLLPERFEAWVGMPAQARQLVSPDVKAVLDKLYQQTLARLYQHPRLGLVMLAAAYGGDQSDATRAHRPEVCYPAQGFSVHGVHRAELQLGPLSAPILLPVRRMVAQLGSRHEAVTYWINTGGTVATSGMEQKLAQMRMGLQGVVPDGLLMRVSTLDRDADRAWLLHRRFIDSLMRATASTWRARVFGSRSGIAHG